MKVWSEDGAGKVVEIPADMTARDVCQLLVYKSHCVDDSAWTLVEHHPILGLGEWVRGWVGGWGGSFQPAIKSLVTVFTTQANYNCRKKQKTHCADSSRKMTNKREFQTRLPFFCLFLLPRVSLCCVAFLTRP